MLKDADLIQRPGADARKSCPGPSEMLISPIPFGRAGTMGARLRSRTLAPDHHDQIALRIERKSWPSRPKACCPSGGLRLAEPSLAVQGHIQAELPRLG